MRLSFEGTHLVGIVGIEIGVQLLSSHHLLGSASEEECRVGWVGLWIKYCVYACRGKVCTHIIVTESRQFTLGFSVCFGLHGLLRRRHRDFRGQSSFELAVLAVLLEDCCFAVPLAWGLFQFEKQCLLSQMRSPEVWYSLGGLMWWLITRTITRRAWEGLQGQVVVFQH